MRQWRCTTMQMHGQAVCSVHIWALTIKLKQTQVMQRHPPIYFTSRGRYIVHGSGAEEPNVGLLDSIVLLRTMA